MKILIFVSLPKQNCYTNLPKIPMQIQKWFGPILRLPRSQSIVQFVRLSRARCIQMPLRVGRSRNWGEGGGD